MKLHEIYLNLFYKKNFTEVAANVESGSEITFRMTNHRGKMTGIVTKIDGVAYLSFYGGTCGFSGDPSGRVWDCSPI